MTLRQQRELARAYWRGETAKCPRHPEATLTAEFVQTTFADHLVFTCPSGREVVTIPQRPRQMEFNPHQVEGLLINLERGDSILCYRCQAPLVMESDSAPGRPATQIEFTCVRCLSWGSWRAAAKAS